MRSSRCLMLAAVFAIAFAAGGQVCHADGKKKAAHAATPKPTPTPSDDPATASARQAIQDIYAEWDNAFMARDAKGYLSHYAPDFVVINPKGQRGNIQSEWVGVNVLYALLDRIIEYHTDIDKLTVTGDTAILLTHTLGDVIVKHPRTGQKAQGTVEVRERSFWIKKDGAWLIKQEHTLEEEVRVNGRPIDLP